MHRWTVSIRALTGRHLKGTKNSIVSRKEKMANRRSFFGQLASLSTGLFVGRSALAQQQEQEHAGHIMPAPQTPTERHDTQAERVHGTTASGEPASEAVLIETPDLPKLPFNLVDGVKEFHLMAQPVETEFIPGKTIKAWGYNGSVPGPTIEVNEGDRVRVMVHNMLPEMTTIHWHGLEVPVEMDGVTGLGQDPVI